jgi:hypothetical protein
MFGTQYSNAGGLDNRVSTIAQVVHPRISQPPPRPFSTPSAIQGVAFFTTARISPRATRAEISSPTFTSEASFTN